MSKAVQVFCANLLREALRLDFGVARLLLGAAFGGGEFNEPGNECLGGVHEYILHERCFSSTKRNTARVNNTMRVFVVAGSASE